MSEREDQFWKEMTDLNLEGEVLVEAWHTIYARHFPERIYARAAELKALREVPLKINVGTSLEISIGIYTMCHAFQCDIQAFDSGLGLRVTDTRQFARDIALELMREGADGMTLITKMLDLAALAAVESGSKAVILAGEE